MLLATALAAAGLLTYGVWLQSRADIQNRHDGQRANPWRGLPGCIYMEDADGEAMAYPRGGRATQIACDDVFDADDAVAAKQPLIAHAAPIMVPLAALTQGPSTTLPAGRNGERVPQQITEQGITLAKGEDVLITIHPEHQKIATGLADCMTGDVARCASVGTKADNWAAHYEQAGARMLALVDMDIATGGVRAIASAHSPCFAKHWSLQEEAATAAGCPTLPMIDVAQLWRLDNHALFTTAMMASTNKPALMLALLRSPAGAALHQGQGRDWVLNTLKTSNSDALFDKLLCADSGFASTCPRINNLPKAVADFGLKGGELDVVPRLPLPIAATAPGAMSPRLAVQNTRLLIGQSKEGAWQPIPVAMPDAASLAQCSANKWQVCSGEGTANLVAELWGQGNSQATAMSAAQMMVRLGAAANGQNAGVAHLVSGLGGKDVAPAPAAGNIERRHAQLIVQGMAQVPQPGGTAHAACVAVWGAKVCRNISFLASKTGTPSFTHERMDLNERMLHCGLIADEVQAAKASQTRPSGATQAEHARCHMQPYKWLVTLVKDSDKPGAPYTRAIAVLAERNYKTTTDRVDSAGDRGINVAAELAYRYIAQTLGEPQDAR